MSRSVRAVLGALLALGVSAQLVAAVRASPLPETVSATPSTLTNVNLSWGPSTIQFTGQGGPVGAHGGAIELLVDGAVHASCDQWSTTGPTCSALNNLPPGPHSAQIRFRPQNTSYGSSTSAPFSADNGPTLPPATGILIEAGRASINHLNVQIDVAPLGGSTAVRLANISTLDGDHALASGTTFDYAPRLSWQLAGGPDGTRSVWAQFQTAGGWSDPVSASIYLDTTPPGGSFVINNGAAQVGDPWNGTLYEQTLDGSATDDAGSPGTLLRMAFSNDGEHWRYEPFASGSGAFSTWWMISDFTFGGAAPDGGFYPGTKTVYGKWQDAAGNWSDVATDTIDYVDETSIANLYIDGQIEGNVYAPTYKHSPAVAVSVTVHIPPPVSNPLVEVRFFGNNEDNACLTKNWPSDSDTVTVPWSLIDATCGYTTNDGVKNVHADIVTAHGLISVGGIVILDRVVPTANSPLPAFTLDHTVNEVAGNGVLGVTTTTSATTTIAWKGTDKNPINDYDLQQQAGSTWSNVVLNQPTDTSASQVVGTGSQNRYRVKATDAAGNTGSWKTGPAFSMSVIQETDSRITYSGAWRADANNDALGDSVRSTGAQGATARFTFTGRAFAWVAPRVGGNATVYVDGKLIKTVLLAGSGQQRQVVFSIAWKSAAQHTVKIVKKYTSNRIAIDAFLVLR